MSQPPEMALFLGRLHPALVHLPIGLLVLLAVLEVVACFPRFRQANANAGLILALTVPAAIFTVICGWLLSLGGGYETRLLLWHKYTGFATVGVCLVAGLVYALDLKKTYRWCLGVSVGALVVASHFGGSLTHGSDYLVRYAPFHWGKGAVTVAKPSAAPAPAKDFKQTPVFAGVVQPLLEKDCVACHGPEKAKAGLRLDSLEALQKGGENGPVVVAGKAGESSLLKRLRLPMTDEDHMPPEGKPQPSTDDLALLQWWIEAGAPGDKKVGELQPPPRIAQLLATRLGGEPAQAKGVAPRPLKDILPTATQLGAELKVPIGPLGQTEPWLQCNASIAGTNFGDAELAKLAPLGANLRWLDLAGTRVSDQGLAQLASMPNLKRLHLERTAITDVGLRGACNLAELEYLNLYGTKVTDQGLEALESLPKLRQLYVWETQVSPAAAKAFAQAHTDQDQLDRWQQEIEQLQGKIRDAQVSVELGTVVAAGAPAAKTNAAPMNALCPVSGKPADPAHTLVQGDKVIAFCCDDCKAKFQKDPQPFLAKLNPTPPKPAQAGSAQ